MIVALVIVFCLLGNMSDIKTLYKGVCGQFGAISVVCVIISSLVFAYIITSVFKTFTDNKHQLKFLN